MDFSEQIMALSSQISKQLKHIETEEATKNAFIMPFINALGYNVFDPTVVVPEYTADIGIKKGEKVDYAIMKNGNPIMLFECKSAKADLEKEHSSQLFRYFSVTPVKVGVLTNGLVYKFYSDLENKNKMDERPFLELNMLDIKETNVNELKRFRKESFEVNQIVSDASELKYTKEIKRVLEEQFSAPSIDFVRFFTNHVYSGRMTKSVGEKFKDITHRAFKQFINEKINDRLKSALEQEAPSEKEEEGDKSEIGGSLEKRKDDGIVTTEEEIEAFYVVRAILHEVVEPERVVLRDFKNFCNVVLDDTIRQPICRFYFDTKQKHIAFFGENKSEEKVPIEKLSEIYKYADRIKTTVGYYDKSIFSDGPSKD